jgi:Enterobacteriaceae phage serine recombinase
MAGRERRPGRMRIGYARVSTNDQSLDLQLDALRRADCDQIFQEEGVSGVATSRPALEKAIAVLKSGDVLITWKLDRLGRSLANLIAIISDLDAKGIGFTSLSEAIDTRCASGRLLFHVMGALAEFERSLISERTRAGIAAARERGAAIGRPAKLTAAAIRAAQVAMLSEIEDVRSLAQRFGVSVATLRRALRDAPAS